jgi:hypothetical protein
VRLKPLGHLSGASQWPGETIFASDSARANHLYSRSKS